MHAIFSRPSPARLPAFIAGLVMGLCASIAAADTLSDVQVMIQQKQLPQALEKVDSYLAAKPKDAKDASVRFLQGVILSEMGRPADAIAVYRKLTEDYPGLPEPYNNLAVLYAQQKQFDKARAALEMALKTHPSYAVAHENLGDIYAQLASQSYDKALQRDSTPTDNPSHLALIHQLGGALGGTNAKAGLASSLNAAIPASASAPASPKVAAVETARKSPDVRTVRATSASPLAVESSLGDVEAVRMLQHWSSAWSRFDLKGALAYTVSDLTCRIMREKISASGLSSSSTHSTGISGSAAGETGCRSELRKSRFW